MNGNYLVVFVSIGIILPLSMLKNLGKTEVLWSVCLIGMHKAEQNETLEHGNTEHGFKKKKSPYVESILESVMYFLLYK